MLELQAGITQTPLSSNTPSSVDPDSLAKIALIRSYMDLEIPAHSEACIPGSMKKSILTNLTGHYC
jgi:hypothetical protein